MDVRDQVHDREARRHPADGAPDDAPDPPPVPHSAMPLDPDRFRSVLGRFASGVTVVTAVDAAGRDHGMTVSAFCSLSLDPPLVLVCVDRDASMHGLLHEASHFTVNILAAGQEALSRRFSHRDADRFDGIGYTRGAAGTAILDDVLAWLECRIVARHAGGDHTIVVGEAEDAESRADRPLLYYRGGYATLER
jgi:flavin reductase (DIM6/NTAB) family NADH-FMN oxidoreductase RutF